MSSENRHQQPSDLSLRMSELALRDQGKGIKSSDEEDEEEKTTGGSGGSAAASAAKTEPVDLAKKVLTEVCENFVRDLNNFGISVLDGFLGAERGDLVCEEVLQLHESGLFREGQLVRNSTKTNNIRGDEIVWLLGNEDKYPSIRRLIKDVDRVVLTANKFSNNGQLGKYKIDGRTKAMVACYPGNGAHYVKHVDNPHGDGRIITAIYYLNKNWDRQKDGGMLRIFPTEENGKAADIDPVFDRMLFFWSDRRNPHEVQPSYRTRYAITIWYFDATERDAALKQRKLDHAISEDKKQKVEDT